MFTLSSYSNLNAAHLKEVIKSKTKYGRYILLYLYNGIDEHKTSYKTTRDLFILHGRDINNQLGGDYTFLTVYNKEIFDYWAEFAGTEELKKQFVHEEVFPSSYEDRNNHFGLLLNLAEAYKVRVSEAPALIVIDADHGVNNSELVAKIRFKEEDSAKAIYNRIVSVINAIKDYYGDFKRIADACNVVISKESIPFLKKCKESKSFCNLLNDYISRSSYNKKTLAEELGISSRQLTRYLYEETKLPRDKAIAIAFLLNLSLDETDLLFNATNEIALLGEGNRDLIIKKCLQSKMNLTYANKYLIGEGFPPIEIKSNKRQE